MTKAPILERWEKYAQAIPADVGNISVDALQWAFFAGACAAYKGMIPEGTGEVERLLRRMLENKIRELSHVTLKKGGL